jgi:hypothetical protein
MTSAREVPALAIFDVGAEGVALLGDPEWVGGDRTSRTLFKADTLRMVLTALRAGAVMQNKDPTRPSRSSRSKARSRCVSVPRRSRPEAVSLSASAREIRGRSVRRRTASSS